MKNQTVYTGRRVDKRRNRFLSVIGTIALAFVSSLLVSPVSLAGPGTAPPASGACKIIPPGEKVPNRLCIPESIPNNALPFQIPAPCLSPSQLISIQQVDLQACKDVTVGGRVIPGGVLRSQSRQVNDSAASGILDNIDSMIRTRIECLYQGVIVDLDLPQTPGACKGVDSALLNSDHTVCNSADHEINTNHLGQSCGAMGRTGNGSWESAQMRGLVVQAMKYYRDKLSKEVENQYRLTITSDRCRSMANDYLALMQDAKKLSDGIIQGSPTLSKEPVLLKKAINFCEPNDAQLEQEISKYTDKHVDPKLVREGIPSSAICMLGSSRENRIALFSSIMECEIDANVRKFETLLAPKVAEFNSKISACRSGAQSRGNSVGRRRWSRSAGQRAGNAYFDNCYNPWVQNFFKAIIDQNIPGQFKTQNTAPDPVKPNPEFPTSLPLLCALGTLIQGRKKRNRKFLGAVSFMTVNFGVLVGSAYLSLSCGGGGGGSFPPNLSTCFPTQPTIGDSTAARNLLNRCCLAPDFTKVNPNLQLNDPAGPDCQACKQLAECNPASTRPMRTAATSALSAADSQNRTREHVSDSDSSGELGKDQVLNLAGATSEDSPGKRNAAIDREGAVDMPQTAKATVSRSGGILSSGAARGDLASGTWKTETAGANVAGNTGSLHDGDQVGGRYATAGSGDTGRQGNWGRSGGFAGSGSIEPQNTGNLEFGKSATGAQDGNPMGSDDPEDYFTRINPADSIFKIVERRYQQKTTTWALPPTPNSGPKP